MDLSTGKAKLRRWASGIGPTSDSESQRVADVVAEALKYRSLRVVLTFLAMPGEVDLGSLADDPRLTLGVTRTPTSGPLSVHYLEGSLEMHPFGFRQPASTAPALPLAAIEAVLVPGVLFSRAGGRLGHGRGYYDQLLASLPSGPLLMGITVDRRVVDDLPMTENDVWMDGIATESGYSETRNEEGGA